MPPRCFAPGIGAGRLVELPDEEAIHLTRVLRLRSGAFVTAFDGTGREFLARVEITARHKVTLRAVARTQPAAEPAATIRLAQAVLKGDSMDAAIRDATMLGVTEIQPIVSARVNSSRAALGRAGVLERWRRIAVASAKQCGRAVVPRIGEPCDLMDLLGREASPVKIVLVEPSAGARDGSTAAATLRDIPPPASYTILVGPEGGWSSEEIARAIAAGFVPLTLGRRTLRADAVAVTALAVIQFAWGDL